jgi:ubiquinone/menaquinone biosynthesis C-methylase UbiE
MSERKLFMTTTTDKGYRGMPMEGLIASWYAKTTQKDLKRHHFLAQRMARELKPGSRVLEIAPGPGYFCIELAQLGNYQITGMDISKTFVQIARENAANAGVRVDFRLGNASDMPFREESFDFMACQAAFKNFSQPVQAIQEMYRVLAPGGKAVIIDLRRDATMQEIDHEVIDMNVNKLNAIFIRWTFRSMLLKRAYTAQEMRDMVAQTSFRTCTIEQANIGFSVWLQKAPGSGI